ncbi:DUF1304 domain-containing protein [Corynebacterium sp. sy039]|uniref:DUF1304 domain-containing protein n=1 Tax=Corynebacterium sp. sy039 TaxID=2599641 RepID=UPI0011B7AE9E|nr:DUF1304 domain-containing protein [Corynebacterium sp. sy039]QDZ41779.1 DUF1304 domain-containing protein [Corynebacterium sp. sy039]
MTIALFITAALAAILHIFIFYLESFAWLGKGRAVFGMSEQQAHATKEMAFNQGFYNLMLAIVTIVGLVLWTITRPAAIALIGAGTGSMFAAALLLFATAPDKRSAAIKQGTLPLLALILLSFAA